MSVVKSFSVGNGDMFYIDHNSDNFTSIDCCYSDEDNLDKNLNEIKLESNKKGITRFISTHPDEDHIKGLTKFCDSVGIANFYCVKNEATKAEETESFKKYCKLRDSDKAFSLEKGCQRKWMNMADKERGCAGINFLWPIISNEEYKNALELVKKGEAYNNISPIFTYSVENGVKMMWMGDMEHKFLEKVKDTIAWPEIDVLFAPHHGRESGKVSADVLKKINPYLVIIGEAPSENLDYYSGYNTITQNSAGNITFKCDNDKVHLYVEAYSYNVSFLDDEKKYDSNLGHYLGSFKPKG